MPLTKNSKLRIEILDEILGGIKKYTFQDLQKKINEKLILNGYNGIGEKTLYNDLKYLREEKYAPIHKPNPFDNTYYYTEKFSIKELLLGDEEVDYLKQAAEILKRLSQFLIGPEIDEIIAKLENKVHTNVPSREQIIQFETHTQSAGGNWLQSLFSAVKEKLALRIIYKPFSKTESKELIFHPYLLKQYRNRWFVFGREEHNNYVTNLALDRILSIKNSSTSFIENDLFSPDDYFKHLVGVSMPRNSPIEDVVIRIKATTVPYLTSKPIHNLQEITKTYKNGDVQIKIPVYINYELESTIMSYGKALEVLKPEVLRNNLKELMKELHSIYK
jgi:predicted DNA-binding transcriptional regulator YafY